MVRVWSLLHVYCPVFSRSGYPFVAPTCIVLLTTGVGGSGACCSCSRAFNVQHAKRKMTKTPRLLIFFGPCDHCSTGRCGTHFLSRLLATAPNVLAVHEAAPNLSGRDTLLAAATFPEKSYAKRCHKATSILRSARRRLLENNASRGEDAHEEAGSRPLVYVETSHLFLKTFSDVVMVSDLVCGIC